MLVLSRKIDQRIMIGNDIVITVCQLATSRVSLGIDAPKNLAIAREEIIHANSNSIDKHRSSANALPDIRSSKNG